jgi:hypothetical protein
MWERTNERYWGKKSSMCQKNICTGEKKKGAALLKGI